MFKTRRAVIVAALVAAACVAGGVLLWVFGDPFGPGRKLVGRWEVMGSGFEDAIREAMEKKDPDLAGVAEKFRSTERLTFFRDGSCRHIMELLGLTITVQGTWKALEAGDGTLAVKFHKKKLTMENPQKGEVQEKEQDVVVELDVTAIGPDQLSITQTDDEGKTKRFTLRRAKD